MKLSQKQLRSLIESTVHQSLTVEAVEPGTDDSYEGFDLSTEISAALGETFRAQLAKFAFDPGDPSMAAAGPKAWEHQKERAAAKFDDMVADVINECVESLINGEFYS